MRGVLPELPRQQVFDRLWLCTAIRCASTQPTSPWLQTIAQTYYGIKPARTEDALVAWTNDLKLASDELEREGVYIHVCAGSNSMPAAFGKPGPHLAAITNDVYNDLRSV